VAVLTDGLADVLSIELGGFPVPFALEDIGGYRPTQFFKGSIVFENAEGKGTLTRGTGADLGSFIDEGFRVGQFILIGGAEAAYDGEYYVHAVTDEALTLTTAFGVGTPVEVQNTVVLSNLTREGRWEGEVTVEVDGTAQRLVRTDLSGWLADLFLEGQRVRVTNLANPLQFADFKIAIIRGDNATFDEKMEFTTEFALPAWLSDGTTLEVRVSRIAPVITFSDTDWYQQRTVELVADPFYDVPITREGVKVFPVSTHLLSKLRGPLAVEGGVTGADRSLQNGLKLPGERDDFLIAIGAQPPESQQIDVLNLFNDSSQQDRDGVMDQTTLRGFGMAEDLDFGALFGLSEEDAATFGESLVFPGGISFGKINFGADGFETDTGQTTIEVLNVMLGEGNDQLTVEDTMVPAPHVSASNVFTFSGPTGANTVFRAGFDWKAQGFLVGQTVTIEGLAGTWTVTAINDFDPNPNDSIGADPNDNSILVLAGPPLQAETAERLIIGIDPLVRTTLAVDVAPSAPVSVAGAFDITSSEKGGTVTGTTPFDWKAEGFAPDQIVTLAGHPGKSWTILAIKDDNSNPDNDNSILVLGEGDPLTAGTGVAETVTGVVPGGTVTRAAGDWEDDGFLVGHLIKVEGAGLEDHWRLLAISEDGKTLQLEGVPLPLLNDASLTLSVAGPHGGLTVVHGGGNMPLAVTVETLATGQVALPGPVMAQALTRLDGLDWVGDRYAVGQYVQVSGEATTRQILGFDDADPSLKPADGFDAWGEGSVLLLSGGPIPGDLDPLPVPVTGLERTVHVAEPLRTEASGAMNIATTSLTRTTGDWLADGFYLDQQVWISGLAGPFTVGALTATTMTLENVALTPQAGVALTVFGYDVRFDGGVRMGGDHITVTGGAGPDSPLVVYGDTSQDGVWYMGQPHNVLGADFGEKPFDPFPELPDGDNEDDEWVFPLANWYTNAGNDVIDASALFGGTAAADLPTVGFVAYGGAGDDLIIGSQAGDHLAGGSGDDTILGQRGVDHIYGDSGVNVNVLNRGLTIDTIDNSPEPTLDKSLTSNGTTIPPSPSPVRDDLAAGRDVIHGDGPGTVGVGPESAYDDIIFGDHGAIVQNVADPNTPEPLLQKIQTTALSSVLLVRSEELQNGGDDVIFGHLGRDVLVGGAGHDMADGDEADDLVFGDNVTSLTRRDGDDGNLVDDITSPRFQTLLGTLLYGRSDRAPNPSADVSGALLTNGSGRNYRDPDGAPWWAEYLVDYADLHTFAFDEGTAGVGSFGNDYLAGGAKHDLVFGQLGHDVIQGDGGIELAFAATSHAGASRTPDGAVGTVVDLVGDLDVVASFEAAATDGEDYIEGGGGNDIVFGGLGQDDILGGSSDFFSLSGPVNRPDGDDLMFGGAGTDIARSDIGDATVDGNDVITTTPTGHADDADTIVGDNGRIIRIVGTNGVDINPTGNLATPLYVSFNYDNYGPTKLIVRGVTLLDYTPGGPDFNPGLPDTSGLGGNIFGADEVHGESGDDTVYTGAGNDVVFGDGQDDDIILGWGDDWASGGTGQDGILGDDGRIFTSRNSQSAVPGTAGYLVSLGEPLYGVLPLLATDPDPQHPQIIHGNVLNEFIYTPGQVQTATINVSGVLNKAFDITPFDWKPNAQGADDPLFDANRADDVIYGGLGDDFLHGAVGDDAISGAEALTESYTQNHDFGAVIGIARSDWTRPYNTGDMLIFGNDDDSWHAHKPSLPGEFALYDEFDPRRVISLNDDGSKDTIGPNGRTWFLNFVSTEGPVVPGGVTDKGVLYDPTNNDGRDVVFGDQGNDWLVGGTGRDDLWGGWGTDLLQADDLLGTTDSGTADNAPDTSPNYEDRAFAGAGYDILIGNTGGDRLIDWVGEFNSYIVPFAPFGIDTVSRQRPPQLDEFLYALSRADGADPTRWTDTTTDPAFQPRNGEPYGEIGLITQKDHGLWQDQTGGPTDPQPGNIPGGKRDVLNSADFNSGSFNTFRVDSGAWEIKQGALKVGAASLGKDALGIFYLDQYLPQYYEISASIMTQKPTGGWKANAYVVFDYMSPADYKFAGIDISINKFVMGHRTASGWIVDVQSPLQVKPDTFYNVLVAVNGTTVTVQVDAKQAFTYTFAPRIIDGVAYGLNKGLVGAGANSARGTWDNYVVQVLPPQLTLDTTEDFTDGVANLFTGDAAGAPWSVSAGRYAATAAAGTTSLRAIDLGVDHLQSTSYVELSATLRTNGIGGLIFDEHAIDHFKFVALDVTGQKVLIGHNDPRRGFIVDASVSTALQANTDYTLLVTLKGASVSVSLNGAFALSFGFNAPVVDGATGVLARSGTTSVDSVRLRTNDPAFASGSSSLGTTVAGTTATTSLTETTLASFADAAVEQWQATLGAGATGLDAVRFAVADLPETMLGLTLGDVIYVDVDAAGHGWSLDQTPMGGASTGQLDLMSVLLHEVGHATGLEHEDADQFAVMGSVLPFNPVPTPSLPDAAPGAARSAVRDLRAAAGRRATSLADAWTPAAEPEARGSWLGRLASALRPSIDWQAQSDGGWRDLWPFGRTKAERGSRLVDFMIDLGTRTSEDGSTSDFEPVGVALGAGGDRAAGNRGRTVKVDWGV
jgi:Ca2+-binding RTX toxin-like protein